MLEKAVRVLAGRLGYEVRRRMPPQLPTDFDQDFISLYEQCKPYTRTSPERLYSLYQAARYVTKARVPGAFVECGVWRGGSAMMAALAFRKSKDESRELWLYDTYEGMSEPGEYDKDWRGITAAEQMKRSVDNKEMSVWCYSSLEEVRANMRRTGYSSVLTKFVKGKVEDTIPGSVPEQISVLRLDTDFYESTLHELEHLYRRVAPGGVLIIDDYGHWAGARKAVDEFFAAMPEPVLLNRIDYTGRIAVIGRPTPA